MPLTKITTTEIDTSSINQVTAGPTIANVSIANSTYVILDDTAVSNAGGYIIVTGTKFQSGAQILIGNTVATSVTFVDSTRLNVQVPALTAGTYTMYVQNPDGSTGIRINALTSSPIPVWSTGSTLTNQSANVPISISLSAPSDSNVTFSLANGSSLPSGTTLASNGLFSGTVSISTETTYNFSVNAIDTENQEALRSFSVTVQVSDQHFANNVLLLNGETNGANFSNTWIQDISTNRFEVTVNGDTRPIGFSPYETVWSNYFDGSGDSLTLAGDSSLVLDGDFTIEFFMYLNSLSISAPISSNQGSFTGGAFAAIVSHGTASNKLSIWVENINPSAFLIASNSTLSTSRWYHVAIVRNSGVIRLYLNGVDEGNTSSSATITLNGGSTPRFRIGQYWNGTIDGYVSNLRVLKGTALYTSAFTSPTSQLTAIANTSLLTCQSNRFIDTSNNNFAITASGNTSISNFSPFTETDVTTGSGYFDGTGDYLTIPDNTAFEMPGDFTVEAWFYCTQLPGSGQFGNIISKGASAVFQPYYIFIRPTGALVFYSSSTGSSWDIASDVSFGTIILNTWYHIAVSRSGSNIRMFLNGSLVQTINNAASGNPLTDNNRAVTIGARSDGTEDKFFGYISDVRIVKGVAVYTAAFTPPTAPLTAVTNTSLLTLQNRLGENSNRFIDETGFNHVITRNGNPTQGTFTPFSQTGWSNYFSATSAFLSVTAGAGQAFGTGDFTVECWLHANNSACNILMASSQVNSWGFLTFSNQLYWQWNGGNLFNGGTVPQNSWVHLAVSRVSGSTSGYVNGTRVFGGTANNDTNNYSGTPTRYIGPGGGGGVPFYVSNARIVKGTGLYSGASITVPTSPLTSVANTEFLFCNSNRFVDTNTQTTAKAVTISGSPTVQAFSPFSPTAVYSTATVGGSGFFDGTGDRLSSTSTINFGSNAFTIEFWLYTGTPSTTTMPFSLGTSGALQIQASAGSSSSNGNISIGTYGSGASLTTTGNPIIANQWNHIVAVRSSTGTNGAAIFINGSRNVLGTLSTTYVAGPIQIGGISGGTQLINGYMSGLIVTNGTANYSVSNTSITLPTAPPTAIANTSFLCNFTNSGIIDYTSRNVLEANGNVRISTSQTKYGSRSLFFDGTEDWLFIPASLSNRLFGDFTIEFWMYALSPGTQQGLVAINNTSSSGSNGLGILIDTSNRIGFFVNGNATITYSNNNAISANTWTHVALVRSGSTNTMYVNGSSVASNATTPTWGTPAISVGRLYNDNISVTFNGYIDDLRITSSFARYTANFTAPTSAFLTR